MSAKRSSEFLTGASFGKLEPDGHPESAPTIDPEPHNSKRKKSRKEALLVTAENIESQNYRFTLETASRKVIELRMPKLECHYGDCREHFCGDHGTSLAISPGCHKNLDIEDMSMPYIEQLSPVNFYVRSVLNQAA